MRYRETGFTLIELMIAIAIVGILSSFAISTYQNSVLRSGRSVATVELHLLAQRQERFYSQNMRYANNMTELVGADPLITPDPTPFYSITMAADDVSFTLTASARDGFRQDDDTDCAAFSLDHTGLEAAENSVGNANSNCW